MNTAANRPDTLRLPPPRRGWGNTFWTLFGLVALAALLVACAVYTAPPVVTDWRIRDTARPVADARVTDGKCSTKIVLHLCDMTLNLRTPTGTVVRRVNTVFMGVHVGDYNIRVMADPARPDLVTTDLALNRLWNRTVTLAVVAAALAAIIAAALIATVRNRRAGYGALG